MKTNYNKLISDNVTPSIMGLKKMSLLNSRKLTEMVASTEIPTRKFEQFVVQTLDSSHVRQLLVATSSTLAMKRTFLLQALLANTQHYQMMGKSSSPYSFKITYSLSNARIFINIWKLYSRTSSNHSKTDCT